MRDIPATTAQLTLNMKGALLFLWGLLISSQAMGGTQIVITPPDPTPNDRVVVTVFGEEGCLTKDPQVFLSGNEIHFDFPSPPDVAPGNSGIVFCPQVLLPWAEAEQIGSLPAGTYDVIVTHWAAHPAEIARASFTVDPFSVEPKKLVCKNLTTGRKRAIQNPAGFQSCAAAGLQILPGDRIRQISTGVAK